MSTGTWVTAGVGICRGRGNIASFLAPTVFPGLTRNLKRRNDDRLLGLMDDIPGIVTYN